MEIDPHKGATGTFKLALSADVVSALTADGAAQSAAITRPGQQIRAEFTAPDAKVFGFALTDSTLAQSGDAYLVGPAGGEGTYLGYVPAHSPVAFYITGVTPGATYAVVITPDTDRSSATGGPSGEVGEALLCGKCQNAVHIVGVQVRLFCRADSSVLAHD
ncbi:hypothetical protein [Streptomyces sp. NPDC088170]|uniref:hypothetical protein n=1 Tax=Streptomyces sp. NPDC088170 TaxID=3365834 RepID=UPI0037F98813